MIRTTKIEVAMSAQGKDIRESLGFVQVVTEHIAPVLAEKGFACTEATPYVIKFESANVFVTLLHDPRSYEIDVVFALKTDSSKKYTLRDMLDAVLSPSHSEPNFIQASEPDRVIKCVKIVADLLQKHGQNILIGESAVYQQMWKVMRLRNEAYTKEVVQEPIRKAAEEAWHYHDYVKVRDLYESIAVDLTPVEKKRLEYAKNHCNGN
jgi:hypothetical protein